MRWLRRAWDGPFRTPPLQQPVSVGWVLLKIIETIWRAFVVLLALITAGIAIFAIYEGRPLSSQIAVSLSSSTSCIEDGFPIRAAFVNKSSKNIGEIDVRFHVYPRGKSEDVSTYYGSSHELRDIVRPGEEIAYCFPMPAVEAGSVGPYTIAADVTYAAELSKDVPVSAMPPPIVRTVITEGRAASSSRSWATKVGNVIGAITMLALFGSGGFGLLALWDRLFGTQLNKRILDQNQGDSGCVIVLLLGILNAGIVTAGGYALGALGWDSWLTSLDEWSRANGYSDAAMMFVTGVTCQWPWAILLVLPEARQGPAST